VLNLSIEQKLESFTIHFLAAAKVIHSRLRGSKTVLSSPPVNNFGSTIRRREKRSSAEVFLVLPLTELGFELLEAAAFGLGRVLPDEKRFPRQ
jgi:hypothetical protein